MASSLWPFGKSRNATPCTEQNGERVGLGWETRSYFLQICVKGKTHRLAFQSSSTKRADHLLELIHSDVCGKIGAKSLGGGEYFVTFIDDHTRYAWVYILQHKSEVFQRFQEWKALVEKSSGRKIKIFRSDNRGKYTYLFGICFISDEGRYQTRADNSTYSTMKRGH